MCLFLSLPENKAIGIMKVGHTFTIEPMISEGTAKWAISENVTDKIVVIQKIACKSINNIHLQTIIIYI